MRELVVYYVPVFVIPMAVFAVIWKWRRASWTAMVYGLNLSMFFLLIYIVGLGIYFKSHYMGRLDIYPSLIISRWWTWLFLVVTLPLNLLFLFLYLKGKAKKN